MRRGHIIMNVLFRIFAKSWERNRRAMNSQNKLSFLYSTDHPRRDGTPADSLLRQGYNTDIYVQNVCLLTQTTLNKDNSRHNQIPTTSRCNQGATPQWMSLKRNLLLMYLNLLGSTRTK
jgi:hypothetical protein